VTASPRTRRALKVLFAIIVIDGTIAGLVGPIQPEFVAGTASPATWITASSLVFVAFGFLVSPLLGALSDVYGRRPVLITAGVSTLIGAVLLLPVRLPFLIANRVFDGASMGAYSTLRAAVVDASDERTMARNTGLVDTIASIGFIVGPAVASVVLFAASVTGIAAAPAVVVASIALGAISLALCLVLPETREVQPAAKGAAEDGVDNPRETTARPAIQWGEVFARSVRPDRLLRRTRVLARDNPGVWPLLVAEFWLNIGIGYYFYFITLIAEGPLHLDPQGIANVSAFWAVILVVVQGVFFGRYVMRIDRVRWVRWLLLAGVLVMFGYAFVGDHLVLFLAVAAIDCVTISIVPGLLEGLAAETVPEAQRGELFGVRQSIGLLAMAISLLLATALAGIWVGAPFLVFAAAFVACWWSLRAFRPVPER